MDHILKYDMVGILVTNSFKCDSRLIYGYGLKLVHPRSFPPSIHTRCIFFNRDLSGGCHVVTSSNVHPTYDINSQWTLQNLEKDVGHEE